MNAITTKHRIGFLGWTSRILFWAFQAACAAAVWINFNAVSKTLAHDPDSAAWAFGALLGGSALAIVGWFVWLLGTVILGIFVLGTRGKSVTYVPNDYPGLQPRARRIEPKLF